MFNVLRCGNYSALLPTTPNIFPLCCPQRGTTVMFHVVAYNADNFFRVAGNNTEKYSNFQFMCVFQRCCCSSLWTAVQKNVGVVLYTVEKWSALLATTRKNLQIGISPQIKPYANQH
jgi:hypothetical protein